MIFTLAVVLLPTLVSSLDYPVGITNCGVKSWIDNPPQRAVTMNQGTTELMLMLALNLSDHMVGTAYLDDYIWSELEDDFNKVPVLSDSYPDIDTLLSVQPDFVYASYSSAFATSHVNYTQFIEGECDLVIERKGENRSHCREELHEKGIQTYLQKPACELVEHRPAEDSTIKTLYDEIWDIASIFGVYDNARKLVDSIEGHFKDAVAVADEAGPSLSPIRVLWLDGWDPETPFVGACCGSIQTIVEKAGADHIFDDQGIEGKKTWDSVSWDAIAERDPDLIVLVDASWDLADEKIYNLCANEHTRNLRAVQNRAFIVVPFSASTLGVRIGALAYNLAEAMAALIRGEALPSLQFSETSISAAGVADDSLQALGKSGVRVYEKLPIWNGNNLDEFCPGSSAPLQIQIRDDIPLKTMYSNSESSSSLSGGAIAGIAIASIVGVALVALVVRMYQGERLGKPLFAPVKESELS